MKNPGKTSGHGMAGEEHSLSPAAPKESGNFRVGHRFWHGGYTSPSVAEAAVGLAADTGGAVGIFRYFGLPGKIDALCLTGPFRQLLCALLVRCANSFVGRAKLSPGRELLLLSNKLVLKTFRVPHVLRIAAILFAAAFVAQAGEARAAHCGDYVRFGAAQTQASQSGETSLPASKPGHGECRQAPAPLAPVPAAPQVHGPGEAMAAFVFNLACIGDSRELALDRSVSPVRGFYEPPARPPKFSR